MSDPKLVLLVIIGCCAAGAAAACLVLWRSEERKRRLRREVALGTPMKGSRLLAPPGAGRGVALRYAEAMTRRLFTGATVPITPSVREKKAGKTRAGARYRESSLAAGCAKEVSVSGFCEARTRLAIMGALAGALAGMVFSSELGMLLGIAGLLGGVSAPMRDVEAARKQRAFEAERHLSEMLEVVALGLRSGLTFDRSFALYGSHFDNGFARSCAMAHRRWALGLTTREEALRDLSASYDCEQLARIVDSVVRSLRFGSALAESLEEAAAQSRASYRAALEERVAKAPVKMMLPTGTLILPAMLLLVMGPVFLELAGGF